MGDMADWQLDQIENDFYAGELCPHCGKDDYRSFCSCYKKDGSLKKSVKRNKAMNTFLNTRLLSERLKDL